MKIITAFSKKYGNQSVLVDDDKYIYLNNYHWIAQFHCEGFYAVATINGRLIKMHRFLLNLTNPKQIVDHKDRNKLNNQMNNITLCTFRQNGSNRKSSKNSSSKYLGVAFIKRDKRWMAAIKIKDKIINLGLVKDEKLAAHLYNEAAREHHGDFANLNIID